MGNISYPYSEGKESYNLYNAEFICIPQTKIIIHCYQLCTIYKIIE